MSYANPRKWKLRPAQKYFLQMMMHKSVIDQINFKALFCSVLDKFSIKYDDAGLRELYVKFLREINEVIRHFNMEIRTGLCEITGLSYFCLIKLTETPSAKLSMLYTPVELRIFRKLLQLIVESDSGSVDFNAAVAEVVDHYEELLAQAANQQEGGTTKVPTQKEIRACISKFTQDHWLTVVVDEPNKLTLHGRALLELTQYIKQLFDADTLHACILCNHLVLNSFSCHSCAARMHRHCAKRFFKESKKCPKCHAVAATEHVAGMLDSINKAKNIMFTQLTNQD